MNCICTEIDNSTFRKLLASELNLPISLESIVNESYCVSIRIDIEDGSIGPALERNEILFSLRRRMGLYHLWIEQDYCGDHFKHRMLCAYVGKGFAHGRIKEHIDKKWVKDETMYVTFFECSNRVAKYLEQLFLDLYKFHLNNNENNGIVSLQTLWDESRLINGTETHEHANILSMKYPQIFNP